MCFSPASKMSTKSKHWNSLSFDDDVSADAILFILLEEKLTNFGFYFVIYYEKFNDNIGLFWCEMEEEAVRVRRACDAWRQSTSRML